MKILTLIDKNKSNEHICCGFSDRKIAEGTRLKKEMIKRRLRDGFEVCDTAPPYFELLVKKFREAPPPQFRDSAKQCMIENKKNLTFVYYDQCPFTDYRVDRMIDFGRQIGIQSQKIKITTKEEAQNAPSAFSVFNIFFKGKFLSHKIMTQREFSKKNR